VPPYPADNSKQQQFIEKSDGHENGAKTIAGVHFVTLMASAIILALSTPSSFDARFRLVIAPLLLMSETMSAVMSEAMSEAMSAVMSEAMSKAMSAAMSTVISK
jgi:hypothetical protein